MFGRCAGRGSGRYDPQTHEDRCVCQARAGRAPAHAARHAALDRSGPGELNAVDKNAIEEALRLRRRGDCRGRRRLDGPGRGRPSRCAPPSRWAPTAAVLVDDPAAAGSDLRRHQPGARQRARARGAPTSCCSASRPATAAARVLWAAVAERLQLPFVSQAAELTVADGSVTVRARDRVRRRRDRGDAARGGRGERRHQRAALHVAQGDDGGQEEAARRADRGRPRPSRRRGGRRPARRPSCSASVAPPARADAVKIEDDGDAAQAIVDFLAERELV